MADGIGFFFRRNGKCQIDQCGIVFPYLTTYQITAVVGWKIIGDIGERIADLDLVLLQERGDLTADGIGYFVTEIFQGMFAGICDPIEGAVCLLYTSPSPRD